MDSKSSPQNTESHENPVTRLRKGAARHGRVAADGMAAGIGGRTPRTGTVSDQGSNGSRPERLGGRLQAGPAEIHPAKDGEIPERALLPADDVSREKQRATAGVAVRLHELPPTVHRQAGKHARVPFQPIHQDLLLRHRFDRQDGLHFLPTQHRERNPAHRRFAVHHRRRNMGIFHTDDTTRWTADSHRPQLFTERHLERQPAGIPHDKRPAFQP